MEEFEYFRIYISSDSEVFSSPDTYSEACDWLNDTFGNGTPSLLEFMSNLDNNTYSWALSKPNHLMPSPVGNALFKNANHAVLFKLRWG